MVDSRPSRSRLVIVASALVVLGGLVAVAGGHGPELSMVPSVTTLEPVSSASPATAARLDASGSPRPASSPLTTNPPTLLGVALVPVVAPASSLRGISAAQLSGLIVGAALDRVMVGEPDLGPLAARLGVVPGAGVRIAGAAAIRAAVVRDRTAIGILRAADVTPEVRALAFDGATLFGVGRVRTLAGWPLTVQEPPALAGGSRFEPAATWTLVAGGDVMLDRAAYRQSILLRKGVDFPWDGGTAVIAGTRCCGDRGSRLPIGRRTGNAGAVRTLLSAADLALVNLEGPAPDAWTYHPSGLVFSFDPALLKGLQRAGIDAVTIANNHIANAGARGIADTVRHLDGLRIGHAGAGADLAVARRPGWLQAAGLRVALLGYDAIRPDHAATTRRAGTAPLRLALARADIRAARAAGADVVLIMVHWGAEYTDAVSARQQRQAAALLAAGADAVIGSHSHWVGPIALVGGRPVLYSLGDLVFELTYDRRTMEGALAELTFVGRRLVQLDLHPTLILDGAQPNLLDPAGDGARLLADVRRASAALVRR